jgi:uncharacterized protein YybS (DUF2232 family)
LSGISTNALVDGGKAAGLSVLFGLVLAFMPVLAILAVPLLPIPVAYVIARHGLAPGGLTALAAGALLIAVEPFSGILAFLLMALAGTGAGIMLRRGASQARLLAVLSALFLAAMVIWAAVVMLSTGMGPVEAVHNVTGQMLAAGQQSSSLIGGQDGLNQLRDILDLMPYLLPSLMLVAAMAFSAIAVFLARPVFARLDQEFPAGAPFRDLRLHYSLAYLMIGGLVCYLVSPFVSDSASSVIYLVGLNMLIVSQALFFVQAIAIAYYFLTQYNVSRVKRIGVYACLVLLQMTLSLPSWMALFDIWFDYRRRFAKKGKISQSS